MHVRARGWSSVPPLIALTISHTDWHSPWSSLIHQVWPISSWIFLPLPYHQHWSSKHTPPCSTFTWTLESELRSSWLYGRHFNWLSHPLSPKFYVLIEETTKQRLSCLSVYYIPDTLYPNILYTSYTYTNAHIALVCSLMSFTCLHPWAMTWSKARNLSTPQQPPTLCLSWESPLLRALSPKIGLDHSQIHISINGTPKRVEKKVCSLSGFFHSTANHWESSTYLPLAGWWIASPWYPP